MDLIEGVMNPVNFDADELCPSPQDHDGPFMCHACYARMIVSEWFTDFTGDVCHSNRKAGND